MKNYWEDYDRQQDKRFGREPEDWRGAILAVVLILVGLVLIGVLFGVAPGDPDCVAYTNGGCS